MSKKLEQSLETYTKVFNKLQKFKEEHSEIFKAFASLEEVLTVAETDLKEIAREIKEPIENKFIRVKISQPYKKWFDVDVVLKLATPKELKIIEAEAMIAEIDKAKFELLVKDGKVRNELLQKAFREEEQQARITIEVKE